MFIITQLEAPVKTKNFIFERSFIMFDKIKNYCEKQGIKVMTYSEAHDFIETEANSISIRNGDVSRTTIMADGTRIIFYDEYAGKEELVYEMARRLGMQIITPITKRGMNNPSTQEFGKQFAVAFMAIEAYNAIKEGGK